MRICGSPLTCWPSRCWRSAFATGSIFGRQHAGRSGLAILRRPARGNRIQPRACVRRSAGEARCARPYANGGEGCQHGRLSLRQIVGFAAQHPSGREWSLFAATGFSNDQWTIKGVELARACVTGRPGYFSADPSQIVRSPGCRTSAWTVERALSEIRPGRFDYVWMIDVGPYDHRLVAGMTLVWRGPGSILYRLNP